MLQLGPEDLDAFTKHAHSRFLQSLMAHWHDAYPDQVVLRETGELERIAIRAVSDAAAFGLTAEIDAASYADLVLEIGVERFYGSECDWIRSTLKGQNPARRLAFIRRRVYALPENETGR